MCLTSPATCTPVNLPSSMATSPVTPSSFNTTASSRLAQVASIRCRTEYFRKDEPTQHLTLCFLVFQLLPTPLTTTWKPAGRSRRAFTSLLRNTEVRFSSHTQRSGVGLGGWRSRSVYCHSNHFLILFSAVANVTTAVDIYSFGMCALEVSFVLLETQAVLCRILYAWLVTLSTQSLMCASF